MSALIPEKVKDVYKDIEQRAIEYAISKIKSTDVIKTKIEDLKKLEQIVTALFIVVMALLIYLSIKVIAS